MTREEVKQLLPIIQALAEGEVIECRAKIGRLKGVVDIPNKWTETKEIWCIKRNDKDPEVFIHCGVIKGDWILTGVDEEPFPFDKIYNNYTFADGTPFGVKVEE